MCVMDKAITAIHWLTEIYVYIYDNVQEQITWWINALSYVVGQTAMELDHPLSASAL